jgi:hypothetical protein
MKDEFLHHRLGEAAVCELRVTDYVDGRQVVRIAWMWAAIRHADGAGAQGRESSRKEAQRRALKWLQGGG